MQSFCTVTNTRPTCIFTSETAATSGSVGGACKSCTQSTDCRCTTTALTRLFGAFASVKAAWCNDAFMVMVTDGSPSWESNLQDVPNPPGSFDSVTGAACVTRTASGSRLQTKKFPLFPTMLATAAASNNFAGFPSGAADADGGYMCTGSGGVGGTCYGLPTRGAVGTSVTGQEIFPVFNNRAMLTPEACEVDSYNQHVGGGGGQPHLHGDPFGSWCLYSAANYTNAATGARDLAVHPPVIGVSADGPFIYGRYLSEAAPGYAAGLDACGGHAHDSLPYHYHAQVQSSVTDGGCIKSNYPNTRCDSGITYAAFPPGPNQCWKGNISKITDFL